MKYNDYSLLYGEKLCFCNFKPIYYQTIEYFWLPLADKTPKHLMLHAIY